MSLLSLRNTRRTVCNNKNVIFVALRSITTSRVTETISEETKLNSKDVLTPVTEEGDLASVPFQHAKVGSFFQTQPVLRNQFTEDVLLRCFLQRYVPEQYLPAMETDLSRFGDRVAGDLFELSIQMEAEKPRLEQFDAWGHRVDRLVTSFAWKKMKDVSAEEGLVASGYERSFGEWSRLYQFSKFYLFEPSAGLYTCPLAMTNGAARTMELSKMNYPELYKRAYPKLVSRNPTEFWTSGQWMTEKQGGSDVASGTETVAVDQGNGLYKLYGYKWFSSATDADITLTLARVVDKNGHFVKGTRGLSLFYLEVQDDIGRMNGIQMVKLKDKLGTRQLPTAELLLDGTNAIRISEEGRGVASITEMLTLTRIHTATSAASNMRRIINLARDYCTKRKAFGRTLDQHALHMKTLAGMEVEARAAVLFCLEVSRLLGRQEVAVASQELSAEKELLRLTVPLMKLYVSKQSVAVASEGLECFGGQGYIEETNLPRILRDTQVAPIWEGTTNILSLDVLRAIQKSSGSVLHHFHNSVVERLAEGKDVSALNPSVEKVEKSVQEVLSLVSTLSSDQIQMAARDFAYSLARIFMASLLIQHASHPLASPSDVYAAQRWCEKDLNLLSPMYSHGGVSTEARNQNLDLVFEGYKSV